MNLLRYLAIFSFVAGATMLAFGVIAARDKGTPAVAEPVAVFDLRSPTPSEATATQTETPTPAPEATPTPTPFNGAVSRLVIPSLKVDAPVEDIGLLANNQLDVPKNPHNTGWYDIYPKPGFNGNAVFSGHVDYYPDIRGPFFNLKNMKPNDEIQVVMEDGTTYKYRVFRKQRYEVENIPMGDIIWPGDRPDAAQWLTLITCGGDLERDYPGGPGHYLQRDVVVAERVQ